MTDPGRTERNGAPKVPWLTRTLLSAALHHDDRRFALADLEEEFEDRCDRLGSWAARRWYRGQAMRSLPAALRGRFVRRQRSASMTRGRGVGMMRESLHNVADDLRIGIRGLKRTPGVVLITVVSLGIGIGAMTAVFGVANSFLFRGSVGISDPETLVAIYTTEDDGEAFGSTSYPDYQDILREIDAVSDACAVNLRTVAWGEGERSEPLLAEEVTGNYFSVTGIQPVFGRSFLPAESAVGSGERVALISYGMWQTEFGGQAAALGSILRINGHQHTVVGVMPDGVLSRRVPLEPDIWVPLAGVGAEANDFVELTQHREVRNLMILGRLAEGNSREALGGQLAVLSSRLQAEYREEWRDELGNPRSFTLLGEEDSRIRPGARVLLSGIALFFFGAAGLILLIACANVTTLFLARAANRSREMALRLSLGASRRRLIVMFLTEGLIPGLGAGVVGLGVASWINQTMNVAVASVPFGLPIRVSFGIDGRVFAVAVVLSVAASLVFGLVPALEGSKPNLVPALKGIDGVRKGNSRSRNQLVVVQCTASVVLLVGATLFVRSLRNAADVDLGLDADRVAVATKKLDAEGFSPEEGMAYIRELRERLGARPDVEAVHVARSMEMTLMSINPTVNVRVEAPGYAPTEEDANRFSRNSVTPGYLKMLGTTILRGRGLEETDVAGAPLVAVVNATFAETLWPGQDPIGRTFEAFGPAPAGSEETTTEKRAFQVVGVARDGKYFDFDDPPIPYYWTSIYQDYAARIVVAAKGITSAEGMIPVLREHIELASGEVQFTPPTTLNRQLSYQFVHLRIASRVLRWGSMFGLFLAIIGIYGIVSFAVTQRTREMAIRMAVGAEKHQVLRSVIRDGMRPAVTGLALGMVVAFLLARLVTSVLVGVSPMDPLAFAGGMSILLAAALLASLVPARRALGIDPMETLREE